jgi:hypothetical protein
MALIQALFSPTESSMVVSKDQWEGQKGSSSDPREWSLI